MSFRYSRAIMTGQLAGIICSGPRHPLMHPLLLYAYTLYVVTLPAACTCLYVVQDVGVSCYGKSAQRMEAYIHINYLRDHARTRHHR